MIELLSPAGDFECLKAAVQNGCDAVYFGSNLFSARAFATNFDDVELANAINYAKLRGVKTHLTLNTLIKDDEFVSAFNVAKKAYELGIDAIIVQDLGLATKLIKTFPDLNIHASTQMTTTNLEGVKLLKKIGFKRIVLSRETSLSEIENICKNSSAEIEVFIHGALCISYSGECLFSSMIGGRSGNRGKCAQPCRLPYSLLDEKNTILDKGYLLSPRDLCGLEFLPDLIKAGVTSLKIEGRMKSPVYVATVTKIYRKYIDLATNFINGNISKYEIDLNDKKELLQVFNRGEFSSGHLSNSPNRNLIFKDKPNNMGIFLGNISKFNANKGLVTTTISENISIGDTISFENENSKYTISELMIQNTNTPNANIGQTVTFGRMKGNININDKIYKLSDKKLVDSSTKSYEKDFRKNFIECQVEIHSDTKIQVHSVCTNFEIEDNFTYDYIPDIAKTAPINKDSIIKQFVKTSNTNFEFSKINIILDNNLFIPASILNDIRRETIKRIEDKIINSFKRPAIHSGPSIPSSEMSFANSVYERKKTVLFNILNANLNYKHLKNIDKIYIPLKYFQNKKYDSIINILSQKGNLYIYMPTIVKDRVFDIIAQSVNYSLNNFKISGIVFSNISELNILNKCTNIPPNLDLVANYTFNIFNHYTIDVLNNIGFSTYTLSPEPEANSTSWFNANTELIVYGNIPLMNMSYCLLGKSNKCYKDCKLLCNSSQKFYLKDRYGFSFRIIPDNLQTISTIYNSKITKIDTSSLKVSCIRYDILDESIEEINSLIN